MTGALCEHVSSDFGEYSPMNSNFGILKPLDTFVKKTERKAAYAQRAVDAMRKVVSQLKED